MALRSADLLPLGMALPLMMISLPARANGAGVQLAMKGSRIINGKPHAVELVYGFEENKPSGAFTLTINR
jgi:hypothetical protein